MASRILAPRFSTVSRAATVARVPTRTFGTTQSLLEAAAVAPVKKPVGAFRGGLFGFLLGSTLAGTSVYYYILQEYKVSNEILSEDIYSLQSAVQRTHEYVSELENKIAQQGSKK